VSCTSFERSPIVLLACVAVAVDPNKVDILTCGASNFDVSVSSLLQLLDQIFHKLMNPRSDSLKREFALTTFCANQSEDISSSGNIHAKYVGHLCSSKEISTAKKNFFSNSSSKNRIQSTQTEKSSPDFSASNS